MDIRTSGLHGTLLRVILAPFVPTCQRVGWGVSEQSLETGEDGGILSTAVSLLSIGSGIFTVHTGGKMTAPSEKVISFLIKKFDILLNITIRHIIMFPKEMYYSH